jgi:Ca-activated chloride channel homolog
MVGACYAIHVTRILTQTKLGSTMQTNTQQFCDAADSRQVNRGHARTAIFYAVMGILFGSTALAEVGLPPTCYADAMLIFDASGSMSGIDAYSPGSTATRIDDARSALAQALPRVTPHRRLGLMTYGPGGHCNISLLMRPELNAGAKILGEIINISPDGLTPLTSAVEQAANVLDYRHKPAVVVLLTDGWETCGGQPCQLARSLRETGKQITVHVVGYRMHDVIEASEQDIADMKCLATQTGGHFIPADSIDELVAALNATLGCPLMTMRRIPDAVFADAF